MRKFILKSALYLFFILLLLEGLVRIFHLYTEDPPRFIDTYSVEKRMPGSTGYAVTGNRNQNFSKFSINKSGFNSHREYEPNERNFEVALVGDSFIEGFHQDYDNSIAVRIEKRSKDIQVYTYGYAGYDFANQMHLVHAYADTFQYIDEIILYMNYENDLRRAEYEPDHARISMLASTIFKIRDNIKLLSYGSKIGILEPLKKIAQGGKTFDTTEPALETNTVETDNEAEQNRKDGECIANFKNLVKLYGFDNGKTAILLDSRKTSVRFLSFLNESNIRYIDYADRFEKSNEPTDLIYDHHWNDHGRELIAEELATFILRRKP